MGERISNYARFAQRFAADGLDGPARRFDAQTLDRAEEALDMLLPVSYREFLTTCGALFVPDLWESVVGLEPGVEAVREFFGPAEIVRDTRLYRSGGMPSEFVGIASDGCGNMFVVPHSSRGSPRPDDLPVLFFDHDYVRVVEVAGSFDGWLQWYLERVPA